MKEKDLKEEPNRQTFIMYAEKEDGTYGSIETGSYLIENDLDDFWAKMEHIERKVREQLTTNEVSAIRYYMVIEGLTTGELSKRAGIPAGKVKKHLTPKGFEKASVADLAKYAGVFNVPVANLFQVVLSSSGKNIKYHLYNKEDDKKETLTVIQDKTKNQYVILTKAEEIQK